MCTHEFKIYSFYSAIIAIIGCLLVIDLEIDLECKGVYTIFLWENLYLHIYIYIKNMYIKIGSLKREAYLFINLFINFYL